MEEQRMRLIPGRVMPKATSNEGVTAIEGCELGGRGWLLNGARHRALSMLSSASRGGKAKLLIGTVDPSGREMRKDGVDVLGGFDRLRGQDPMALTAGWLSCQRSHTSVSWECHTASSPFVAVRARRRRRNIFAQFNHSIT